MRKQRAFTLIEFLVVIAIVAILIGVLISALSSGPSRATKKIKDATQIAAIQKAMFNWAAATKENQFPPLVSTSPNVYGGTVDQAFATLLNGISTNQASWSTDPLPPITFICPMSNLREMTPYGVNPATGSVNIYTDQSFYDSSMHCSYGVLNGGQLNKGKHNGCTEGRYNNGRATVPLVYNALNYAWKQPVGGRICDWNPVATGNADDWKGNIGWGDGHVKWSETPIIPTTMQGVAYKDDNLHTTTVEGPDGDARMGVPTSSGGKLAGTGADPNWDNY